MPDRDIYDGDDELNLTPEAQRFLRPDHAANRPEHRVPPASDVGAERILRGLALGFLLLLGLAATVSDRQTSSSTPEPSRRAADRHVPARPQPQAPQYMRRALQTPPRRNAPSRSLMSVRYRALHPNPDIAPFPLALALAIGQAIPQGWRRGIASRDITLRVRSNPNAITAGRIRAGMGVLYKPLGPVDPTWHLVFSKDGRLGGFAHIHSPGPEPADTRFPLPPGWFRAVYEGERPAELRVSQLQVLSVLYPGTEMIMRKVYAPDVYFVISADGVTWGYARFAPDRAGAPTSMIVSGDKPWRRPVTPARPASTTPPARRRVPAKSYIFTLSQKGSVDGVELKAGKYKLTVDSRGDALIWRNGEFVTTARAEVIPLPKGHTPKSVVKAADGAIREIRLKRYVVIFSRAYPERTSDIFHQPVLQQLAGQRRKP